MLVSSHRRNHTPEARVSNHILDAAAVAFEHGHDELGEALKGRADSVTYGEALYIEDISLAGQVQEVVVASWLREGYSEPRL